MNVAHIAAVNGLAHSSSKWLSIATIVLVVGFLAYVFWTDRK